MRTFARALTLLLAATGSPLALLVAASASATTSASASTSTTATASEVSLLDVVVAVMSACRVESQVLTLGLRSISLCFLGETSLHVLRFVIDLLHLIVELDLVRLSALLCSAALTHLFLQLLVGLVVDFFLLRFFVMTRLVLLLNVLSLGLFLLFDAFDVSLLETLLLVIVSPALVAILLAFITTLPSASRFTVIRSSMGLVTLVSAFAPFTSVTTILTFIVIGISAVAATSATTTTASTSTSASTTSTTSVSSVSTRIFKSRGLTLISSLVDWWLSLGRSRLLGLGGVLSLESLLVFRIAPVIQDGEHVGHLDNQIINPCFGDYY